ncbi:hypothetical protein Sste5346_007138 [Sporothrix stenoceras]|uniref:FAR1 domain-containing protein n=1 Tax=Sporothrix stenoceras TaxID=5173 RepID=A0ABR3YWF7_9PEZI
MEQLQQQIHQLQQQHNQLYGVVHRLVQEKELQQQQAPPPQQQLLPQPPPYYPPSQFQTQYYQQPPPQHQNYQPPPLSAMGLDGQHEHRLRLHAEQTGGPQTTEPRPQLPQLPGVPPPPNPNLDGPPCGAPPPCWVFPSIEAATEAIKAHALANGYTLVLRSRLPSNDQATVYNFRCGKGGHRRAPEAGLMPDGTPKKLRNRTTQKTGCPFHTTVKRDKYAPAPSQVWRVSPPTSQPHNHSAMSPLSFTSQRSKLLEAHRDSILLMHNDGIRVGKIRQYLKLTELPKTDVYNIIRKYTKTARENLMAVQRQQQAELQQIAGQLGQVLPPNVPIPPGLLTGGVEDLTDEGQLRQLMEADKEDGDDDDEVVEDDEDDEEELEEVTDVMEEEESEEE